MLWPFQMALMSVIETSPPGTIFVWIDLLVEAAAESVAMNKLTQTSRNRRFDIVHSKI
jgi:hypothetical protein